MNPLYCIRNTGNSHNLFRATPILIGATHVVFRASRSDVHKKSFMSYFLLQINSVDYHDGVHFVAMCKL